MEKPKLPIDELTNEEFRKFKEKYLDDEYLTREALKEIDKLFAVGDPSTGTLYCDGEHSHRYECVGFYHPSVGVVHRLVIEVRKYKATMEEVRKKFEKINK